MPGRVLLGALLLLLLDVSVAETTDPAALTFSRASSIVGMEVEGTGGERLGQVREILLDSGGQARYLVIAYGGFLGLGDKLTAIPWGTAQPEVSRERVIVRLTKEALLDAPTLSAERWQRGEYAAWTADVDRHFQPAHASRAVQFSDLDVDGDGQLSFMEAQALAGLGDRFTHYDQDRDGSLSRSEFGMFEAAGNR